MKKFLFVYNNEKYYVTDAVKNKEKKLERIMGGDYEKLEIYAESKKEAVRKFKEKIGGDSESLKEYTTSLSFTSIIESLLR